MLNNKRKHLHRECVQVGAETQVICQFLFDKLGAEEQGITSALRDASHCCMQLFVLVALRLLVKRARTASHRSG